MGDKDNKELFEAICDGISENKFQQNKDLGITQEYNQENRQKLWDSSKDKRMYKEQTFGDKNSYYDPISGNMLNKTQKAAQNKYHMKNSQGENVSTAWADHAPETDHIIPLKEIHNRTKNNVFLSDSDLKEIANQKENYRVLSKHCNASKGDQSDFKLAFDPNSNMSFEARKTLITERTKAEVYLDARLAARTAENMGGEFVKGSSEMLADSVIPLTAEAVRRVCNVASGKESLEEAVKGLGKSTVEIAVVGGGKQIATDMLMGALKNSEGTFLKGIVSDNTVNQIISVGLIVKDSAVKYINGEISGEEFIEELGDKGVSMVASMIVGQVGKELGTMIGTAVGTAILPGIGSAVGFVAGKIVGQLIGTLVTTVACTAIFGAKNAWKHINDYKEKEKLVRKVENEALAEMAHQRDVLKEIIQREYNYWDDQIRAGFDQIIYNACEDVCNAEGVAEGLDRILKIFGQEARFHKLDEYEDQLNTTLRLSF